MMDGGMAEDVFEDMLYDEYAKKMSDSSNFGIAKMLYRDLSSK
jgi:flagellar protein FlgJ